MIETAHVIRRFTFSEWGGTESVVWNTVRTLRALGNPVEILATQALDRTGSEEIGGIPVRRFDYFYPYFPLTEAKIRALDKKGGNPCVPALEKYLEHGKFDLLHCHTMGRIAGTVRLAAKRRGIPYVISFHGGCFDVPANEMAEMLKPLRHTVKYGAVLDRILHLRSDFLGDADGLICVGRNELEPTRNRYPGKPVEYLPNGVDPDKFSLPPKLDFRKQHSIPPGHRILLSVSRIDYQKNQLALLDVLERLGTEWHLVLIGAPTALWYYEKLKSEITRRNLAGRTTVIPGLSPDSPELTAAYSAADVFALPSLHEPFGIVILEAWSAGVPVIASDVGGIPYLVEDGRTGFLAKPSDPERWAGLVKRLSSEPGLRESIVSAAGKLVRERYSWDAVTKKLLDFYSEVLARKKTAAR